MRRLAPTILSSLLLLAALAQSPAAPERHLALTWNTSEFIAMEGSRLRLQHRYDTTASPLLWLEAEHPSSLQLEANKTVLDDSAASGGRCVAFVDKLVYVIDVPEAATYESWTRCFFPFAASWNHTEGFDAGDMRTVSDMRPEDKEQAGKWVWVRGPQYELKAGANNYVFDGYHGGAKLDRILLSRDLSFVPDGMGGPASTNIAAHRTGRAETRDLRLGPVEQWLRVEGIPAQGVTIDASIDAGQSWKPLAADGTLVGLPARAEEPNTIRFRAELTRTDDHDPIVERLALAYAPGDEKLLTVANSHLRLGFSRYSGSLAEMVKLGEETVSYMAGDAQHPLFRLYVQHPDKPDELAEISAFDGDLMKTDVRKNGRQVAMEFALLEGKLLARVTVRGHGLPGAIPAPVRDAGR